MVNYKNLIVPVNRMLRKQTPAYNAINHRTALITITDKARAHHSPQIFLGVAIRREDEVEIRSHPNLVPQDASLVRVSSYCPAHF